MGRLNRNLYVMLKLTERSETPGWLQKKNSSFPEGNNSISSFAGDLVLIWMKQRLIWFNLQKHGTRNGLCHIKETCVENLQLKMSVLCTKIWAFWSLKFIWWLGKINVKKKCLMCQILIKMLKQHATSNSRLHNLKIYSSKGCRKTNQRWIYDVHNVTKLATYLGT